MTYKELAAKIALLTDEQQDMTVTIMDGYDEYWGAGLAITGPVADVLDANHPFLRPVRNLNPED